MLPYLKVYFIVPVANYEEKMMTVGEEVKEPQVDTDTYFIWFSAFSRVKWTSCVILGKIQSLLN